MGILRPLGQLGEWAHGRHLHPRRYPVRPRIVWTSAEDVRDKNQKQHADCDNRGPRCDGERIESRRSPCPSPAFAIGRQPRRREHRECGRGCHEDCRSGSLRACRTDPEGDCQSEAPSERHEAEQLEASSKHHLGCSGGANPERDERKHQPRARRRSGQRGSEEDVPAPKS